MWGFTVKMAAAGSRGKVDGVDWPDAERSENIPRKNPGQ